MLRVLRERKASWILRILLLLVAVTFISWGGSYLLREKKETYAAKVNGVEIDMKEYIEAYDAAVKQYRDALGAGFSDKMIAELHLKEKVLDNLISRVLVVQEASRLGLSVSDEELKEAIESIPSFRYDGQFDPRTYERFLRINRMTAADFERLQRQTLLMSKVTNLIRLGGGQVVEDEALDAYRLENERINLSFLKVAPEAFKGQVAVNEIEMKDYYQKHQEEFRTPTYVQVQYLLFRPADVEGRVQVSSEEIKRYYDLHKDRFKTPKRVKAKDILIKVGPQEASDKIEEKAKKAAEILEKAKKTKDFGSLAKQYSESNTATKGGDMGWVQKGSVEPSIEGALLSLKPGEVSGVVRGREGFHIFKAEEVVEEQQRTLEEVKDQVLQTLKREKAKNEASRRSEDAFYSLFRNRDLEGYAREKDVPIRTTGFFKEGDEIPGVGPDPTFTSSAFSLKVGEISPVVSIPPNFYVLKLVDKKDSRVPPLEEVKEQVRLKVVGGKADEKARQVAEELLKQVQTGKTMREAAQEKGFRVDETGFFTRTGGMIPKIGPAGEFMGDLSSISDKHPVPKDVLKTKEGYFVVKLLSLEPADQAKFLAVKKDLERRLSYQKQDEFFQSWLQQLRAKAKVQINKGITPS